jgi:hypothetical protein
MIFTTILLRSVALFVMDNMNVATKNQKEKAALMTVQNAMAYSYSFTAESSIFTNISTMPMRVRGLLMEKIRGS